MVNVGRTLPETVFTIGSMIGWGNYFPLADMAQWKVDSRTVFLRECNGGNSLCYPFGTWTGPYTYDFDRFNDAVTWFYDNNIYQCAHLCWAVVIIIIRIGC